MFKLIKGIFITLTLLAITQVKADSANDQGLRLTTFNAGLAHTFVLHAEQRVDKIVEELNKLDTDVICLQEVWTKKDRKKLEKGLKKNFPHAFKMKIKQTRSKRKPTCKIKELFGEGKFVQCMKDQCSGLSGDAFTSCIINKCGTALENLKNSNRECAQGLMAQVGKSTLGSLWAVLNPFVAAGQYTYKGSTGLMILSKLPLEKTGVLDFSDISFLSRRAALKAVVKKNGRENQLYCTHLTANLDGTAPYAGALSGYREENLSQVDRMIKDSQESDIPTFLLGDFNCSKKNVSADVEGEFEESCKKFSDAGFKDPIDEINPECTFCRTNNLVNEGNDPHGYANKILDHIFTKGMYTDNAEVVMKQKVKIKLKDKEIDSNLSDHFGVTVNLGF